MKRKLSKAESKIIEDITEQSLKQVGIKKFSKNQVALLIRLFCSGIADYFYDNPDNIIEIGFLKFKKNPEKEEVFAVDLITNEQEGVTNANTLYRYYKGDLWAESRLKETMNNFVNELLSYSQSQSNKITSMTSKLQRKGGA